MSAAERFCWLSRERESLRAIDFLAPRVIALACVCFPTAVMALEIRLKAVAVYFAFLCSNHIFLYSILPFKQNNFFTNSIDTISISASIPSVFECISSKNVTLPLSSSANILCAPRKGVDAPEYLLREDNKATTPHCLS